MTRIPADFPVKELRTARQKSRARSLVTCADCGRSWDDAVSTGWTPAPAARCPFEYYHAGARIAPTAEV